MPVRAAAKVAAAASPSRWRARAEDGGARRASIVDAATSVLGRRGYADTSLKDIAREAGVAPGLLHYYFDSKDDLLLEVVAAQEREMNAQWQAAVEGIRDPLERVVAALDQCAVQCSEKPEFWRTLFDLYNLGLSNAGLRKRTQEMWCGFLDDIEREVEQVTALLPAPPPTPPRAIAAAVAGAIDGIALAALVEEVDARERFQALKAMVLSLLVTSYVAAGLEPPLARAQELLQAPPRNRVAAAG